MTCMNCGSVRVANISGKCSDMCVVRVGDREKNGYVPGGIGVGGGDYLEVCWCLECGKIQGDFPIAESTVDEVFEDDDSY